MGLNMDLCPCFGSKKGKKPKRQEDRDFSKESKPSGNSPANTFQGSISLALVDCFVLKTVFMFLTSDDSCFSFVDYSGFR